MQKNYLSNFLSLVVVLLLMTACEKESIQTDFEEVSVLTESEQATVFLKQLTATLPLASLQIDHKTNQVSGFFIDKEANLRTINVEDAPYLGMDEITLDRYFMEQIHLKSKIVEALEPTEVVNHLKVAMDLTVSTDFTVEESETTSEIFVFFRQNLQGNNHNRDCVGGNRHAIDGTFNKILIAGSGKINFELQTEKEKSLVDWMKSMKKMVGN